MSPSQRYYYAVGKRKCSIAQIRLYPAGQGITVNGKPLEQALPWSDWQAHALEPLKLTETMASFKAEIKVKGGGFSGQAGAIRHALARALLKADESLKPRLRKYGVLTRDSRIKESKKYGLKRARRAPQYTKR